MFCLIAGNAGKLKLEPSKNCFILQARLKHRKGVCIHTGVIKNITNASEYKSENISAHMKVLFNTHDVRL